jgi:hypothetical protein
MKIGMRFVSDSFLVVRARVKARKMNGSLYFTIKISLKILKCNHLSSHHQKETKNSSNSGE